MALVPMEERLKSREKAWEAERRDLQAKAEDNARLAKIAEERSRELEKRKSEMTEERWEILYMWPMRCVQAVPWGAGNFDLA